MAKWWFRTVFVVFILSFLISIPGTWLSEVNKVYNDCMENLGMISLGFCNNLAKESWTYPGIISESIVVPVVIFYLLQLIFFKVVIDYIVLGGNKQSHERTN